MIAAIGLLLSTGYIAANTTCKINRSDNICTQCPCNNTKYKNCTCTSECSACTDCTKKQPAQKIIKTTENANEVTISITLQNTGNDTEQLDRALTITKNWGKELAHTLQEETPNVKLRVNVAGVCCNEEANDSAEA